MIHGILEQDDLFAISKTGQKKTLKRWLIAMGVKEFHIKENALGQIILAKAVLDSAMGVEVEVPDSDNFVMDLAS